MEPFVSREEKCKYLEATFNKVFDTVPCKIVPGK